MRSVTSIVSTMLYCVTFCTVIAARSAFATGIWCGVDGNYSEAEITWDASTVRVHVENPLGFAAMPQFEAPVSSSMLPAMQAQSKKLEGLGSGFTYQWTNKQCTFSTTDQWLISCQGIAATPDGDNGIQALVMTTAHLDETSLSATESVLRLRFVVNKDNLYFVAIPFPLTKCRYSNATLAHNQLEPGITRRKPISSAPKK